MFKCVPVVSLAVNMFTKSAAVIRLSLSNEKDTQF